MLQSIGQYLGNPKEEPNTLPDGPDPAAPGLALPTWRRRQAWRSDGEPRASRDLQHYLHTYIVRHRIIIHYLVYVYIYIYIHIHIKMAVRHESWIIFFSNDPRKIVWKQNAIQPHHYTIKLCVQAISESSSVSNVYKVANGSKQFSLPEHGSCRVFRPRTME